MVHVLPQPGVLIPHVGDVPEGAGQDVAESASWNKAMMLACANVFTFQDGVACLCRVEVRAVGGRGCSKFGSRGGEERSAGEQAAGNGQPARMWRFTAARPLRPASLHRVRSTHTAALGASPPSQTTTTTPSTVHHPDAKHIHIMSAFPMLRTVPQACRVSVALPPPRAATST